MTSATVAGALRELRSPDRATALRARDAALSVCAAAFGIASPGYPLGHDQSIHFVVAHEWLHGALPYRDVFDHKPPGIYLLHMLAMRLFGEHPWAIRPLELVTVVALGWMVAMLATPRGVDASGRYGTCALAVSFVYYGFFTFLSTAQPELWATTFALAAIALARSGARPAAIGLACGFSLMMKPTAAPFVALAFTVLVSRAPSRARAVIWFGAGLAGPIAVVLGWLAARGVLAEMIDALVFANHAYVRDGRVLHGIGDLVRCSFELYGWFHPLSTIVLVAMAARLVCRSDAALRRWALGVALVVAGYASVVVQMRFHIYHYVTIVPGIALLLVAAIEDVSRRADVRLAAVLVVLALYPLSGRRARTWWAVTTTTLSRDDAARDATFVTAGGRSYVHVESRAAADWLRARAAPGDRLAVRGCSPEIHALSGMRPATRFFWTTPYTDAMASWRGAEWARSDHEALERNPPRFVVVDAGATRPEPVSWFEARGWRHAATLGRFVVLEADGLAAAK
jgi:hypothetical protein